MSLFFCRLGKSSMDRWIMKQAKWVINKKLNGFYKEIKLLTQTKPKPTWAKSPPSTPILSANIQPTTPLPNLPTSSLNPKDSPISTLSTYFSYQRCPNAFYTFDSQLSQRKTGFGYGMKYDFTQVTSVSPPSTKYNSKSFVDDSKKHGLTFGLSR